MNSGATMLSSITIPSALTSIGMDFIMIVIDVMEYNSLWSICVFLYSYRTSLIIVIPMQCLISCGHFLYYIISLIIFSNSIIVMPIGSLSFGRSSSLSIVILTNGLTIIGPSMFHVNNVLSSVTIPSTAISIGKQ